MLFDKGDSHCCIRTVVCVISVLIFTAFVVRMELKMALFEKRLHRLEEQKVNCCHKGNIAVIFLPFHSRYGAEIVTWELPFVL